MRFGKALAVAVAFAMAALLPGTLGVRSIVDQATVHDGPYFVYSATELLCYRWIPGTSGSLCSANLAAGDCGPHGPAGETYDHDNNPATAEVTWPCEDRIGNVDPASFTNPDGEQTFYTGGDVCSGGSAASSAYLVLKEDDGYAPGQTTIAVSLNRGSDGTGCEYDITLLFATDVIFTHEPTNAPTLSPSSSPTTAAPTLSPTTSPTTAAPTTAPSTSPTTAAPTVAPSSSPTTAAPSLSPSLSPTTSPTSVQELYDVMAIGERPSQYGRTWAYVCAGADPAAGPTDDCPAWGKHEWCDPSFEFFDAPKVGNGCTQTGVTIREGKCYTCFTADTFGAVV